MPRDPSPPRLTLDLNFFGRTTLRVPIPLRTVAEIERESRKKRLIDRIAAWIVEKRRGK